jgi:hypothetical protein
LIEHLNWFDNLPGSTHHENLKRAETKAKTYLLLKISAIPNSPPPRPLLLEVRVTALAARQTDFVAVSMKIWTRNIGHLQATVTLYCLNCLLWLSSLHLSPVSSRGL